MYLELVKQLTDLNKKEDITPELINLLLNAYQEISVDYYKHQNPKISSIDALIITKEMYKVNFEEILEILESKDLN